MSHTDASNASPDLQGSFVPSSFSYEYLLPCPAWAVAPHSRLPSMGTLTPMPAWPALWTPAYPAVAPYTGPPFCMALKSPLS